MMLGPLTPGRRTVDAAARAQPASRRRTIARAAHAVDAAARHDARALFFRQCVHGAGAGGTRRDVRKL